MPLPTIPTLPDPPARTQDPGTFSDNADAFLGALPDWSAALEAFGAAIPEEIAPENFNSTSTTSLAIGTGSKSLTVQTGRLYYVGQYVGLFSTASPTNWMIGQVVSYNSGTGALVVNVTHTSGSGTLAAWTVGAVPVPAANFRPRVSDWSSTSGTATPDFDNFDLFIADGLTGTVTFAAPTATTLQNGDKKILWVKDNGTTRTLNWNAIFRAFGSVALPSATTPNKWIKVGLEYNSTDSKFDVIALAVEQ
jgi:hypothetical protein